MILSGCTSRYQPEQVLSAYVDSLSRSKFVSVAVPEFRSPPLYPDLKLRQRTLTSFDVSILDFLSLQQCDVGFVAGEKNSVLGRVMPNSQRFLYEINIIRAINSCDISDPSLAKKLMNIAKIKRQELPIAYTNAVFNGAEGEAFFSVSNGFIPLQNSLAFYQPLLISLRELKQIGVDLATLPEIDSGMFEGHLKVISDSEYAGQLLYSLVQLTRFLNGVSESISQLPADVCGPPADFLRQQFEAHYIKIIQPYMARVNGSAYQLLPLIEQIAELGDPLPSSLKTYLSNLSTSNKEGVWGQYTQASQRHAAAWSQLFSRCHMSLTSSRS